MTTNSILTTDFGGGSLPYKAYRPGYPKALFDTILPAVPRPYAHALDIGAGTGLSTGALCAVFDSVTAVEPDERMVRQAAYLAGVALFVDCAETLTFTPHTFQLVTAGNAFYWTDGPALLPKLESWLAPTGVFAAYRYDFPTTNTQAVNEILLGELAAHWDAHRHPRLRDTGYSERTIRESGLFARVELHTIPNGVPLSAERLVGFFASTSYVLGYTKTLADPDGYLTALLAKIKAACAAQPILVDFGLELILAAKKP